MKYLEYEDKETKRKERAVDIISVIEYMAEAEAFNGVSDLKVSENWYTLKNALREMLIAEIPKEKK